MDEPVVRRGGWLRRSLLAIFLTLLCLPVLLFALLKLFLATSCPREQLSRVLTEYLGEKVDVAAVASSGGTLYLTGVTVASPPGFGKQGLARIGGVVLTPDWGDLIQGKRTIGRLSLEKMNLNLEKNRDGDWNFTRLQHLLASRKPSPKETVIRRLVLREGAVRIDGNEVRDISLEVSNLTAKGSLSSRLELACEDQMHNRYRVTGILRPGKDPALELSLSAPELHLLGLARKAKLERLPLGDRALGSLQIVLSFQRGQALGKGELRFDGVGPSSKGGRIFAGSLTGAVEYDTIRDRGQVEGMTLSVDGLGKLHGSGFFGSVKKRAVFDLLVSSEPIRLDALQLFLPEPERTRTRMAGALRVDALHLLGEKGSGIREISGGVLFKDVSLERTGRTIFAGMDLRLNLTEKKGAIAGAGVLRQRGAGGAAVMQQFSGPVAIALTPQFKPVRVELPRFQGILYGIPLHGRLWWDRSRRDFVEGDVRLDRVALSAANPWLKKFGARIDKGMLTGGLIARGNPRSIKATIDAKVEGVAGGTGGKRFAAKSGRIVARGENKGGALTLSGDADFAGLEWGKETGNAGFLFIFKDHELQLDRLRAEGKGISLAAGHLGVGFPQGTKKGAPIKVRLIDGEFRRGALAILGLSGQMTGGYHFEPKKWIEGSLDLVADSVSWEGAALGGQRVRAIFDRNGVSGALDGTPFGGNLSATAVFDPFVPGSEGKFSLAARGVSLARVYPLLSKRGPVVPSDGVLDLKGDGTFGAAPGLSCRFQLLGREVALNGAAGRRLVSGTGWSAQGEWRGNRLLLEEAVLALGSGPRLTVRGDLEDPWGPGRKGYFSLAVPESAATALMDPVANALPRFLQEATVSGALAARAEVAIEGKKSQVEGSLILKKVRLEHEAQKMVVEGVEGTLPISLVLGGGGGGMAFESLGYSRGNFPALVTRLRQAAAAAPSITIGRVALGNLELGRLTAKLSGANGITEITALSTTLFDGTLLGRGSLVLDQGVTCRGDLLISGLSLKRLCGALSGLTGYISGRVDGIISLAQAGKGMSGIKGFVDLWAREGAGERMLVSREFLQRLAKQKISGFFLSSDRPYDQAEIKGSLEGGWLTFDRLVISHTNILGVRDLSVSTAPTQNRIELEHLWETTREAVARSKKAGPVKPEEAPSPPSPEFKWDQ